MSITCTSQKLLALKAFLFEHPAILALIEMFINHQRTICIREGFPEFKDHGYILLTAYRCDSISEVTELCEVDRNTVRRWIDRFLKKAPSLLELNDESELKSKLLELLADLPRSGRPSKRTLERVILLNMLLAVKPDTLAREDCIVVSPEFKENFKDVCKWNTRLLGIALNISPATVSRYLKKFNISLDNQGTSKVKEAQSNPSKAMALVSELLKYSEKPSRKETVRKVTQQQIDKQVAQVKTRQRQKEAAEQAGNEYRINQHKAQLAKEEDKLRELQAKYSEQNELVDQRKDFANRFSLNMVSRLNEAYLNCSFPQKQVRESSPQGGRHF